MCKDPLPQGSVRTPVASRHKGVNTSIWNACHSLGEFPLPQGTIRTLQFHAKRGSTIQSRMTKTWTS